MKQLRTLVLGIVLSACAYVPTPVPTPTIAVPYILAAEDNPYSPRPDDGGLRTAGVVLTSINLSTRVDLTPNRVELNILGSLPSVCNQLRIKVNPPDDQYRIMLDVYSLVNPETRCDNVFQQFQASVLLGLYSPGRYTVWINQGLIADFISYP